MIYSQKKITLFIALILLLLLGSCSNKINTWGNRQYHMATTRWNVLFNAKESFKEGRETIKKDFIENFDELLPVYYENNIEVRQRAEEQMKRVVDKMVKAIELHSITAKPKRKKGKRDSEKYREFRRKKEYNNLIDECYLLLGKGQFYKREYYSTERTFRYIMRTYRGMPIYYETAIWYARTLAEQDKLFRAMRTLNDVMAEKDFPQELKNLAYTAKADFLIRQKKFESAIKPLEYLVKNTNKNEGQTRFFFLLAQLYTKQNQLAKAQKTYQRLLDTHPENKYAFQASLSKSLLYEDVTGEVGKNDIVVKQLRKLIRDGRNEKFLDEVYFTLGKVYETRGNIDLAIKNYELSINHNKENEKQKVKSLMALATINFKKKKNYVAALDNYKKVQNLIKTDDAEGKEIALRIGSLSKLAENLGVVTLQDSLLRVARMPKIEREKLIRNILLAEKKTDKKRSRRERKRLQEAMKSIDRPIGNWYFYNSLVVASGIKDFEKEWGKIALTDNWMRERQPLRTSKDDENTQEQKKETKDSNTYMDYIEQLPLTQQKKDASTRKIIESLYNIGLIYEEELADYPKAIEAFEKLLSYNPSQEKYIINSNYHLFLLNTFEDKNAEATAYKERIIRDFPNHRLTKVLKDPAYYAKLEKMAKDAEILYQKAYKAYDAYDYDAAKPMVQEGIEKYKDVIWYDKFLYLDAMLIGYAGTPKDFEEALDKVLRETSSKTLTETVLQIKKQLASGKMPNREVNKNTKQWTIADFVTDDKTEEVLEDESDLVALEIPENYKDLENEKHYMAIILPKDMNGDIVDRINSFVKNNTQQKMSLSRRGFGLNTDIILIEPFADKIQALGFLQKMLLQKEAIMSGINEVDYKIMLIADSNLRKLTVDKNIDVYTDFYENHYDLNATGQTAGAKNKKTLVKNAPKAPKTPYKGIYKYNENAVYNFVLLVPRKGVDVNYLWTALHKFNKNFKVKKESLGKKRMLIVQNIGTEKQAMEYLEDVVGERYIYGVIENTDYRNFIISKENLELLRKSKNIDEYITFFKSQFL